MIHEFAHKIDMRERRGRRLPAAAARLRGHASARDARAAWFAVLQPAYDDFREKTIVAERFGGEAPWLDAYGADIDRANSSPWPARPTS